MIKIGIISNGVVLTLRWLILIGFLSSLSILSVATANEESRDGHDPAVSQAIRGAEVITNRDAITIAIPDDVFSSLRRGKPVGIIAEAVDQILFSMGYTIHYVSMPYRKEMRQAVRDGTIDVATSVLTAAVPLDDAYYTDPIIEEYNVVLVRRGDDRELRFFNDLYGKRIGGRVGYKYPSIESNPAILLELNRKDGENVRKLLLRELDAVIVGGVADLYELRTEGIMSEVDVLNRALGTVSLGAILADERFRREDVDEFNRQLSQLKISPLWQQILKRNGMSDLIRQWPLLESRSQPVTGQK